MNVTIKSDDPGCNITVTVSGSYTSNTGSSRLETLEPSGELETVKTDREDDKDFSGCQGFNTRFMGVQTPLPEIGKQLMRKVAFYKSSRTSFVLKYYNYSTVQHSLRKIPIYSVINIDGNPGKREDDRKRKDDWLRDNRIDEEVQLNDTFYKKSGFDKGHMSRREDANWGNDKDEAFRNANETCMYTNACPQVPELNRAVYGYHGLWGELEQIILENGVEQDGEKKSKICVYNGPIMQDNDPVYNNVQIPLRFFKIVVWLNAKGEPKTTAFILSQEDQVNLMKLEDLRYDEEFKEHQCSVKFIESLTDLTFSGISQWDTFIDDPQQKGVKALSRQSLVELAKSNK